MNDDYYYARSDDYSSIRERKVVGCHEVAMVHSSQLIDLRLQESDFINFHPSQIKDYPGKWNKIRVGEIEGSFAGGRVLPTIFYLVCFQGLC